MKNFIKSLYKPNTRVIGIILVAGLLISGGVLVYQTVFAVSMTAEVTPEEVDISQTVSPAFTIHKYDQQIKLAAVSLAGTDFTAPTSVTCSGGWTYSGKVAGYYVCTGPDADSVTITLNGITAPAAAGVKIFSLAMTDVLDADFDGTKNITVKDLAATISISPITTNVSQIRDYTLTVNNPSGEYVDNITSISGTLTGFAIDTCSAAGWTTCTPDGSTFALSGGTLASNTSLDISINATAPVGAGAQTVSATITGALGGIQAAGNTATITVQTSATLASEEIASTLDFISTNEGAYKTTVVFLTINNTGEATATNFVKHLYIKNQGNTDVSNQFTISEISTATSLEGGQSVGLSWNVTANSVANGLYKAVVAVDYGDYNTEIVSESSPAEKTNSSIFTVDSTNPILQSIVIESSNVNPALAKVGDVVTLNIISNEDIQAPTVTISGHSITPTQGGDVQHWTAQYTMISEDTEGTVAFSITPTDLAGNTAVAVEAITEGSNVTFDKTLPTFSSIVVGPSPSKSGVEVTVTFTASENLLTDPTVMIGGQLAAKDGTIVPLAYVYKRTLDGTESQGTATVSISGTDLASNTGTDTSGSLVIDFVAPTTTDNAPATWQNADVIITLTPTDPAPSSNLAWTKYCTDNGEVACDPASGTSYSGAVTISTLGVSYFRYASQDNAGNLQATVSKTLMIDKTNPVASATGASGEWVNSDQTATVGCSDEGGSVCDATSYKYKVYDSNPGACSAVVGEYTSGSSANISQHSWVCSYVKDTAGNEDFSDSSVEFTVDKTAPSGGLTGVPADWQNTNATISLTFVDTGGSGVDKEYLDIVNYGSDCTYASAYSAPVAVSSHSTACWKVVDFAGNITTDSSEIKVDKINPTTEITSPEASSWQDEDFTGSFSYADTGGSNLETDWCRYKVESNGAITESYKSAGACSGVSASIQKSITVGAGESNCRDEGIDKCKVFINAFDNANNSDSITSRTFSIDFTAPVTTLTADPADSNGADGWYTSAPGITLGGADAVSGVTTTYYNWDGATNEVYVGALTAPEGTHTLNYYSVDNAGNEEVEKSQIFKVDITDPIVNAGSDRIIKVATLQDDATASDAVSEILSYAWTGPAAVLFDNAGILNPAISADPDGVYIVTLTITDNAGRTKADTMQLTWDTEDPTISGFNAPVADAVYKGDVDLQFTPDDTATAVTCSYTVNSVDPITSDVACTAGVAVDTTISGLSDGRHAITVTIEDGAENLITTAPVSFVVDNDNTLTVGASGQDFTTIQEAINKATAGDKVDVLANPYNENLTITKNLTLAGANFNIAAGKEPGIRGDESIINGGILINTDSVVEINGLTIVDGAELYGGGSVGGITVVGSGHMIKNNIFIGDSEHSCQYPAIHHSANGGDNLVIDNNEMYNWCQGVYFNPSSGHTVTNNNFHNNQVGIGSDGLSNVAVNNNIFKDNALEGWGASAVGVNVSGHLNKFINTGSAVAHYGGEQINAINNWWGVAVPDFSVIVLGDVDYDPWYLAEAMGEVDLSSLISLSEIYVDDSYPAGLASEGLYLGLNAFNTIQEGVDAAVGSTVYVEAGTYNEDITIDKSLTLNGAQVGIDARGRSADESEIVGSIKVTSDASDVTIDGFEITGTGVGPLAGVNMRIESASSVVKNNIINTVEAVPGYTYSGFVDLDSITSTVIEKNDFSGAYESDREPNVIRLGISGAGTINVRYNEMHNVGGGGGIGIMSTNAGAVINIENNKIDNTGDCIWVWSPDTQFNTLNIEDNEMYDCQKKGLKVVGTISSGAITINENKIYNITEESIFNDVGGFTVDATSNWWGTYVESEITAKLSEDVVYDPWYMDEVIIVLNSEIGQSAIYVDDDYDLASCGIDLKYWGYNCFDTIQEGIDAAQGSTVHVAAGTYVENVVIDKSLTLQGAAEHGANIQGTVELQSDNITLDGFEITNFSQIPTPDWSGVYILGSNAVVSNNLIDGAGIEPFAKVIGVQTLYGGTASGNILDNQIQNVHMGIYLQSFNSEESFNVTGNTIENTTWSAIGIDSDAGVDVSENIINNCVLGIEMFRGNVDVTDNIFTGGATGVSGIYIYNTVADVIIDENKITGYSEYGVYNNVGSSVDAEANWWGDMSGPYNLAVNPSGIGNAVSDNVDVAPWYTSVEDFAAFILDEDSPTAQLPSAPINPVSSKEISLSLTGDEQVVYYKYKLDAGSYGVETAVGTSITETGLSEGEHTISVIGRDQAGNWQGTGEGATTYIWTVDTVVPVISSLSVSPDSGYRKINDTVTLTINADQTGYTAGAITVNGEDVTDFTDNLDNTYTVTYTVEEGDSDVPMGAITASVVLVDSATNANTAYITVVDNDLIVDANTPIISSITSDASGAGWLKVGDTINFTLTPASTELNATVVGSYNGDDLTWDSGDGGVTYEAIYTLTEGDDDQFTALQIVDVTIEDQAGNISASVNGSVIVKTIDAHTPTANLLSTFAGQTLNGGNIYPLSWEAADTNLGATPIRLEYSSNEGVSWTIISGVDMANSGSYNWTVPTTNTSKAMLRVTATDNAGNAKIISGGLFSITYTPDNTPPTATLYSPNGGETIQGNSTRTITWSATDNNTPAANINIKLEYSTDGSATWKLINGNAGNSGAYIWTVPDEPSTNVFIRVTATDNATNTGSDMSNAVLTITKAPVYICTDAGGGEWTCNISLNQGQNLMSLPVIVSDTGIESVLGAIKEKIDSVLYYNPSEPDLWQSVAVDGDVFVGDLSNITDGKGYFVNMKESATLTVVGTKVPLNSLIPLSYPVGVSWNLIGFKSTISMLSEDYLSNLPANSYTLMDAGSNNKNNGNMDSGYGYWLQMNTAGTITPGAN